MGRRVSTGEPPRGDSLDALRTSAVLDLAIVHHQLEEAT